MSRNEWVDRYGHWVVLGSVVGLFAIITTALVATADEPDVYEPGDTADVKMGQTITLRLPRGQYEMTGDDGLVTLMSSKDQGKHTVVTLLIGVSPTPYDLTLRFTRPDGEVEELDIEAEAADA